MSVDRLTAIKRILDDQNTLGARADTKAVALLTTLGLFTVFFVYVIRDAPANFFSGVIIIIYLVTSILSLYNIVMTIYPRTSTNGEGAGKSGPDPHKAAFFADICRFKSQGDYKECLQEMLKDEQVIEDVYTNQIYEVSRLTAAKYKYTQRSVYFVMAAVASEVCLIVFIFLNKILS
jgi:hypothetical protein